MKEGPISVKPFDWREGWPALWELRAHQLAENGVIVEPDVGPPDFDSPYERDYHHIEQVYLTGAGNFWLAWWDEIPVGHVGAQDWSGGVELRHMYVRAEYRRRGVATRLVRELIAHCIAHNVEVIELWTAPDGAGRLLYEKVGFRVIDAPGKAFKGKTVPCPYIPSPDEIRMRLIIGQSLDISQTCLSS